MSWTRTLANLRSSIETTADMVSGGSNDLWTTAEKNYVINESIAKLYDMILDENKAPFNVREVTFTTTAGTTFYTFTSSPISITDFYRVVYVNAKIGGFFTPLNGHSFSEAAYLQNNPSPSVQIQLGYVPSLTQLSSDSDTFDFYNGWDEFVRYDGAIKLLERENGTDLTLLLQQRDKAAQRVLGNASQRDMYTSRRIGASRARRPRGSWWAGYQIPSYMVRTQPGGTGDGIQLLFGGPWI